MTTQIRWMIRRDMPEVLLIERQSFDFAWSEEDFLDCLRQSNCIGMVAEVREQIVGFMIYELHKSQLHVVNFAVSKPMRRQGVGTLMMDRLISKLSQQRRREILLRVRETNLDAQLFLRWMGFRCVGIEQDYYDDTTEDAYLMRRGVLVSNWAGESIEPADELPEQPTKRRRRSGDDDELCEGVAG